MIGACRRIQRRVPLPTSNQSPVTCCSTTGTWQFSCCCLANFSVIFSCRVQLYNQTDSGNLAGELMAVCQFCLLCSLSCNHVSTLLHLPHLDPSLLRRRSDFQGMFEEITVWLNSRNGTGLDDIFVSWLNEANKCLDDNRAVQEGWAGGD